MKVLVLGMGNPILSDDGVGLFVTRALEGRIKGVDVVTCTLSGLSLLDVIVGYDKVFLADALILEGRSIGELRKLQDGEGTLHLFSSHGTDFFQLLQFGRELRLRMPEVGGVYGIEIGDHLSFSEELSLEMKKKTKSIIDRIVEDIKSNLILNGTFQSSLNMNTEP